MPANVGAAIARRTGASADLEHLNFILDLAIVALVAGVAGLLCRALNLSVVVGFLAAGIVIGPHTPPIQFVSDVDRVRMLADLGLLFLVFGIGLGFNIRRIKRLGAPLLLATALGAMLVLVACRSVASLLGFDGQQGLFIAGILMVSSSAIIAKVLEEMRVNHERWGQTALGVTLLEDIVAIVMLTLLSSMTNLGEGAGPDSSLWETISAFSGFVVLFSAAVLLLIPKLLRKLETGGTPELKMLVVAGLLLGLGWGAVWLGYSMALTAFILGAIIGSTPHRPEIDRLFEGLRHLFGAVFFVAMGMMFNVGMLGEFWLPMVALALAAILFRTLALGASLVVAGNPIRDALRSGLTLTPLGEFSFVIAFLGVQSGVMPESFYPAALGASLLTGLLSPLLIRRAEPISVAIESALPRRLTGWLGDYRAFLDELERRQNSSFVWKLVAPRFGQIIVQVLVVAGIFALAGPIHDLVEGLVGANVLFPNGTIVIYTIVVGLLVLPPLVAVWRNVSAVSMILAEALTMGDQRAARLAPLIHRSLTSAIAVLVVLWLSVFVPAGVLSFGVAAAILMVLILSTILLWSKLIHWQSTLEVRLQEELHAASMPSTEEAPKWKPTILEGRAAWNLRVEETTLPRDSRHAGKRLIDLRLRTLHGCTIVGIDRQGFAITTPSAHDRIFPGDRLMLLGSSEAIQGAAAFLSERAEGGDANQLFDELATEDVIVPEGCPCEGKSLRELDLVGRFKIQIAAIRRQSAEIAPPGPEHTLKAGDSLLVLGAHRNVRDFQNHLAPTEQQPIPAPGTDAG